MDLVTPSSLKGACVDCSASEGPWRALGAIGGHWARSRSHPSAPAALNGRSQPRQRRWGAKPGSEAGEQRPNPTGEALIGARRA